MEMGLNKLLINIIDNAEKPVVVCSVDFCVIYLNKMASEMYEKKHGTTLLGSNIRSLMNDEMLTRLDAAVEWFKESTTNKKLFVCHSKIDNDDVYIKPVRNEDGEVIAFYNFIESRTPETAKEYDFS